MSTKTDQMPVLMPKGCRYAGQPANVASRRSIVLDESTLNEPRVVLDYFYHDNQYWRATIPTDAVDQVCGQSINFSKRKTRKGQHGPEVVRDKHGVPVPTVSCLNHLQTRFLLKPGHSVKLYPLGGDIAGEPVHRISDFIYSIEITGPEGVRFNIRDAVMGNFLAAHRFLSTDEIVFERMVLEGMYILESPPIPLDDQEKQTVLIEALKRSHQAGMHERYYLLHIFRTNNCTSNPFRIVDRIRKYTFLQRLGTLFYRLPLRPRTYLRIRGLDLDSTIHKHLHGEFEQFSNDPEVKRRKREFFRNRKKELRGEG